MAPVVEAPPTGQLRAIRDARDVLAKRWAKAIRDHRTHVRKMTQAELAEELGVTAMAVSTWETGARIPSDYLKVQIIQHLLLDARELFAPIPLDAQEG